MDDGWVYRKVGLSGLGLSPFFFFIVLITGMGRLVRLRD
jgi:hypothetical protein